MLYISLNSDKCFKAARASPWSLITLPAIAHVQWDSTKCYTPYKETPLPVANISLIDFEFCYRNRLYTASSKFELVYFGQVKRDNQFDNTSYLRNVQRVSYSADLEG